MGLYKSLCVLITPYECLCVPIIFMGPNGSLDVLMRPYGSVWVCINTYTSF